MCESNLSKVLVEKARKELNEIQEKNRSEIELLRGWLAKQPHLNARADEIWLLNILRHSKFCQQRAREKVDLYYSMKNLAPEFHEGRDPFLPEIQEILNMGIFLPFETPEKTGILVRWQNADPKKATLINILKVGFMLFDIFSNESHTFMVTGQCIVIDFSCFPFRFLTQGSPSFLRKMSLTAFDGYPARISGLYIINTSVCTEAIVNIMTPFLSEKIRKRVKVYSRRNLDEFHKNIPRSSFPTEYEGKAGSIAEITGKWKQKFERYRDWFLADQQYRVDESKRPGNPTDL